MRHFLLSVCLYICLSTLQSTEAASSEPHYVITVPAQMQYPSKEQACVTFLHLKEALTLRMEIQSEDKHVLVTEDKIDTPNFSHCYPFQVPPVIVEHTLDSKVWLFHVSAQGGGLSINQTKKVLFDKAAQATFIQTDKPMYKPGQTVNFRVITLNKGFHAVNEKYRLVALLDPNDNRIGQWLNATPKQGIADFSFPLATEIPLGTYKIDIPYQAMQEFEVSEYVLKRFEVKLNAPSHVAHTDESFPLEVCGSYTYGKSVYGSVKSYVCLNDVHNLFDYLNEDSSNDSELESCKQITEMATDSRGCVSSEVDLKHFNISSSSSNVILVVSSALTENSTGHTEKGFSVLKIEITNHMELVDVDSYYQKGIPFTGMLRVKNQEGEPYKNQTVYLVLDVDEVETNITLSTDEKGLAHFTLDTSEWKDMVSLRGMFSFGEEISWTNFRAFAWLLPFYSESNSYLKVETISKQLSCQSKQQVKVEYFIDRKELDPTSDHLTFFYLVLAKGGIVSYEQYKLPVKGQTDDPILQGHFSLQIPVTLDLYPEVTLLVFSVFLDGEVAADRARYQVPRCFRNKVELHFSQKTVRPGQKVGLAVQSESGSWCSIRSVDKGLLLHKKHVKTELPTKQITLRNYLTAINKRGFPYKIEDFERYPCLEDADHPQPSRTRRGAVALWYQSEADVYSLFKESSLKVFTNTRIRKPVTCTLPSITKKKLSKASTDMEDKQEGVLSPARESKKPSLRKFFPETWLYDLVSVGTQGSTLLNLTTPDSITEWVTDALCLGPSGFGESHGVSLTTFKPYFIDLLLPYSVVQGEEYPLTALVFSYVKKCLLVVVSLSPSSDFTVADSVTQQSGCICPDQSVSFTWNITATKPGTTHIRVSSGAQQFEETCTTGEVTLGADHQEDALEKTIVVKPLGELEEKTQTSLLCPSADIVRQEVSLKVPDTLVLGSEHAHIKVLGDIMGNTISNVGRLLLMPFGCGEQNMVDFAPNIYILQYLEDSKQITADIRDKAINYLTVGYQRQLMFKHDDASYSAFGKKDEEGNTWLTAFVIRSFGQARRFIYIDEKHILEAVNWLSSHQKPNGCFQSIGKLFNNQLKSEVDDEVTLASYISISLLELRVAYNLTLLDKAMGCLKNSIDKVQDNSTYALTLLAYAFTLSEDNLEKQRVLEILEKSAIRKDGSKYWELLRGGSGNIEMSSYIILALLSGENTPHKHIEQASEIVSWVIKQQNPRGGFISTQDTVVALQALAKYAKATYSDKGDVTVTVRALSGFQVNFLVDKSNRFLLQRETLPHIPGYYTVTAVGSGCVYVQTHLNYHIPTVNDQHYFELHVSTYPGSCTPEAETEFVIIVSTSYSGNRISSNMVLVEVELLSGFFPDKKSVKKMEKNPVVKRTEVTPDKVSIYLEELTHEKISLTFSVKQETAVKNLQPASVTIYDYYSPDERAVAEYNAPCSQGTEQVRN